MAKIRNDYHNYFQKHYKSTFSKNDLLVQKVWLQPQWELINALVPFEENHSVFEMGCGLGYFYQFLNEKTTKSYVGIDVDQDAVDFSKSVFPDAKFYCSTVEDFLPNHKLEFDRIVSFEVLEHVDHPYEVIELIYDSLKVDGWFVGSSPYPYLKNVVADRTHQYVLHPMSWKTFFLRAGFSHIEIHPMSFLPYVWRKLPLLHVRLPFYLSLPYFVSTSLILAKK
jgi:2-polyprenyl-3-methyl-5-hydroxy-6-metoxy-1,4-benzoquinol methylase